MARQLHEIAFAAVLLDLDGTLAETAGEIAEALRLAFVERGLEALPEAEVRDLVGRGVRVLVERALARAGVAADAATLAARFEFHYERTVATSATLYPDAREALDRFRAAGVPLAVVTNKPRAFTLRLIDALGIADALDAVVAGDDGPPKKPAPDLLLLACAKLGVVPERALMLGDSANDVDAAHAAGCAAWCVPYGYTEGRPAASLGADRIVASLGEAADRVLGEHPDGDRA